MIIVISRGNLIGSIINIIIGAALDGTTKTTRIPVSAMAAVKLAQIIKYFNIDLNTLINQPRFNLHRSILGSLEGVWLFKEFFRIIIDYD